MSTKVKKIKAYLGFGKTSDADLIKELEAVLIGMTNSAFTNPPVALADFDARDREPKRRLRRRRT